MHLHDLPADILTQVLRWVDLKTIGRIKSTNGAIKKRIEEQKLVKGLEIMESPLQSAPRFGQLQGLLELTIVIHGSREGIFSRSQWLQELPKTLEKICFKFNSSMSIWVEPAAPNTHWMFKQGPHGFTCINVGRLLPRLRWLHLQGDWSVAIALDDWLSHDSPQELATEMPGKRLKWTVTMQALFLHQLPELELLNMGLPHPLFSLLIPPHLTTFRNDGQFFSNSTLEMSASTMATLQKLRGTFSSDFWTQQLPHFKELQAISAHNVFPPLPLEDLMRLPPTITDLRLRSGRFGFEIIRLLPRQLRRLDLPPMIFASSLDANFPMREIKDIWGLLPSTLTRLCFCFRFDARSNTNWVISEQFAPLRTHPPRLTYLAITVRGRPSLVLDSLNWVPSDRLTTLVLGITPPNREILKTLPHDVPNRIRTLSIVGPGAVLDVEDGNFEFYDEGSDDEYEEYDGRDLYGRAPPPRSKTGADKEAKGPKPVKFGPPKPTLPSGFVHGSAVCDTGSTSLSANSDLWMVEEVKDLSTSLFLGAVPTEITNTRVRLHKLKVYNPFNLEWLLFEPLSTLVELSFTVSHHTPPEACRNLSKLTSLTRLSLELPSSFRLKRERNNIHDYVNEIYAAIPNTVTALSGERIPRSFWTRTPQLPLVEFSAKNSEIFLDDLRGLVPRLKSLRIESVEIPDRTAFYASLPRDMRVFGDDASILRHIVPSLTSWSSSRFGPSSSTEVLVPIWWAFPSEDAPSEDEASDAEEQEEKEEEEEDEAIIEERERQEEEKERLFQEKRKVDFCAAIKALPRSLETLVLDRWNDSATCAPMLPSTLTSLDLRTYAPVVSEIKPPEAIVATENGFCARGFASLPSTLKRLYFHARSCSIGVAHIAALPRGLSLLHIGVCAQFSRRSFDLESVVDDDAPDATPTSALEEQEEKTLMKTEDTRESAFAGPFKALPPTLETLELPACCFTTASSLPVLQSMLPPTLTNFSIHSIDFKHLEALPPHVTHLSTPQLLGQQEEFADPTCLQRLYLTTSHLQQVTQPCTEVPRLSDEQCRAVHALLSNFPQK